MSDRNGDGLPVLAAVKADRVRKLQSQQQAAEFALSRRRNAHPPDDEQEPLAADEHEPDEGAVARPRHRQADASSVEEHHVPPDQPADETEEGKENA
jgi:hypothetical protein